MYSSSQRALVFLALSATLYRGASANCTNFTAAPNEVTSEDVYTSTGTSTRVSQGVNCTGSALGTQPPAGANGPTSCSDEECWISTPLNLYIEGGSFLNISTPNADSYNSIMKLLKTSVSYQDEVDWNGTQAHAGERYSYGTCMSEGQSGYIGFTPNILCTEGVLTGCSGDGPSDGTPIRACGNILMLDGSYLGDIRIVQTDSLDETYLQAPPNATIPDNSANVPGNSALSLHSAGSVNYLIISAVATAAVMLLL